MSTRHFSLIFWIPTTHEDEGNNLEQLRQSFDPWLICASAFATAAVSLPAWGFGMAQVVVDSSSADSDASSSLAQGSMMQLLQKSAPITRQRTSSITEGSEGYRHVAGKRLIDRV